MVDLNEWKKKWVSLQRTWVSKRTVYSIPLDKEAAHFLPGLPLWVWCTLFTFNSCLDISKHLFDWDAADWRENIINNMRLSLLTSKKRVWNIIKQKISLHRRYDTTLTHDIYNVWTHVYVFLFSVKKTPVWIIASLTFKMTSWGYPMNGIYLPSLS